MQNKSIKIICIILSLIFIFSSCSNPAETIDINLKMNNINSIKKSISDKISLSHISDDSYSYLSDEVPGDLYSTYYSLMYLDNVNKKHRTPVFNSNLLKSTYTIQDLFYIYNIFEKNLDEENTSQIYNKVLTLYSPNGYFIIEEDYKSENIYDDENLLYSTWIACKIINSIDNDFDYSDIKSWLAKYYSNIKVSLNIDTDTFEFLLMFYELNLMIETDEKEITTFLNSNFVEYEKLIMQEIGEPEFVFHLSTYLKLLKHLNYYEGESLFTLDDIINRYENKKGGFSVTQVEESNPFPVYVFSELFSQFDLTYNFNNCTKFVLRHQRDDAMFIPYTITDGDIDSSFYAYLTRIELGEDISEELKKYCNSVKDEYENNIKYIFLDNLYSKTISNQQIIMELAEFSHIGEYSNNELNNIILLLKILDERGLLITEDITSKICLSLRNTLNQISKQDNKQIKEAMVIDEYTALSAYILIDKNNTSINSLATKLLKTPPRSNLINSYYYVMLLEIVNERLDGFSVPQKNIAFLADILVECITESGCYSFERDEASINMTSNYYGTYIGNYLGTLEG